jgi:putative hemolysin
MKVSTAFPRVSLRGSILFSALTLGVLAQDPTPPAADTPASKPAAEKPATKRTGLANPASVNCEKKGGKLEIRKGKKGEYGVCKFPNGKECEEWALFRGKCSPEDENAPAPVSPDQK